MESEMSSDSWILLMLTLFAGAASPGPSLALVMRTAISNGRRAGVLVAVAHGFGVWLYALAVALGIASILFRLDWGMTTVQLMGVLFIAYLGISMISGGLKTLQYKKQDSVDTNYSGRGRSYNDLGWGESKSRRSCRCFSESSAACAGVG